MNRNEETRNNDGFGTFSDDEEVAEIREETQPLFRSARVQYNLPQPQLPPQIETEPVELFPHIAPWTPLRINRYPSDYPEERICVEDLSTVAFRVSECNRIRSIEAKYDNDTATAECITSHNTHFRVMLSHGETERHIIMDIRRISGCSLVFQEEYRALMNAAKFGEITTKNTLQCIKSLTLGEQQRNNGYIPLPNGILEKDLLSMNNHLQSECHDIRVMALEDVASTTNPGFIYDNTALNASKIIMEQSSGIRDSVTSIILNREVGVFDDKYIRSLSLTILSNVLSNLSAENILAPFIQDKWYISSLLPSLIDEIKTAGNHPCNASLAAKCLSALFVNSAEASLQARKDKDLWIALKAAKLLGKLSHANLEKEAQVVIEIMVEHKSCGECPEGMILSQNDSTL